MSELAGKALFGTCGWSYDDWADGFYPAGIRKKDRLHYYSRQFPTVEIDSTFYATPVMETVQGWYERTPDDFIFTAKFPRFITHERRLMNCGAQAEAFVEVMSELGKKMGPLLIQLPPSMDVRWIGALQQFLEGLPDGFTYAVEVRHRSWLTEAFANLLKRWKVAVVLPDGGPLDRFWRVTSQVVYIRWLGQWNSFDSYGRLQREVADDLDWWFPRIDHFLARGGILLGYVNNNFAGHSPAVVKHLQQRLGED